VSPEFTANAESNTAAISGHVLRASIRIPLLI
jgi:hypothetical protein